MVVLRKYALLVALVLLSVLLSACIQPITVANVDTGSGAALANDETTSTEYVEPQTELQYNGQTYVATYETATPEAVEPTGEVVDGKPVYTRPGVENQIFLPNEQGVLELWVPDTAEDVPLPECADDSWSINGVCKVSEEDSSVIAEMAITDGPTYDSGGVKYVPVYKGSKKLGCDYCWEFSFEFTCYFPGYGDLSGTLEEKRGSYPHTAVARVEQGTVKSLVYDGVWDELGQRMLE